LEQLADAVFHLASCLVGKGYRKDSLGRDAVPLDESSDPHGQYSGLPGARARQHQQGAFDVLHRFLLGRIQRAYQHFI
jgi:hypothetical protein